MRKLIANTFVSLDGVMQAPGGPDEDLAADFRLGGWSVNYWDEQMATAMAEFMAEPFDLLLGRKTYDIFAQHWPKAAAEDGAGPLNAATKYVASRGKPRLEWADTVLLDLDPAGDAAPAVARLKKTSGRPLHVHGSSEFLQSLIKAGLIDQFQVMVFPVILGGGKKFLAQGLNPAALQLIHSQMSSTGVIIATYEPAGELITGDFGES